MIRSMAEGQITRTGWYIQMNEPTTTPGIIIPAGKKSPNAERHYEIVAGDLPLHCPMEGMSLWNSHPKVFLPIEQTGHAKCPYCGAEFTLT